MHRVLRVSAVAVLLVAVAGTAVAASVHFKNNRPSTLRDNGLTATVSGCLAGLGNQDLLITVVAEGLGSATCRNKGGNEAPGQNKVLLTLAGSQTITASAIKNGNVCFNVTTKGPSQPTAVDAGCPNGNWTARFVDVSFTRYTVTVQQGGATVFTYSANL